MAYFIPDDMIRITVGVWEIHRKLSHLYIAAINDVLREVYTPIAKMWNALDLSFFIIDSLPLFVLYLCMTLALFYLYGRGKIGIGLFLIALFINPYFTVFVGWFFEINLFRVLTTIDRLMCWICCTHSEPPLCNINK
jgi:hypothetical protein